MNTVTLIGTLTRDPEVREHAKTKVCDIRLAESGGRKESPMYINVSAFGRQADVCEQFLKKGRQVAVAGQLRFREWQAEDGAKRSEHTIAADRIDFLGGGGGGGNGGGGGGRGRAGDRGNNRNGNGNARQGRPDARQERPKREAPARAAAPAGEEHFSPEEF